VFESETTPKNEKGRQRIADELFHDFAGCCSHFVASCLREFKIEGLGFRVFCLGFRVEGLGIVVQVLRVSSGFNV